MTAHAAFAADDRLLKIREVIAIVGLGKTTIYRMVREHSFPQPFKPAANANRWSEREVRDWLIEIAARRAA